MAVSQSIELLEKLRKKTAAGPWVFLMDFFDSNEVLFETLTNYYDDVNVGTTSYKEYPFIVIMPELTQDLGSQIQLTFPNVNLEDKGFKIREFLNKIKKIRMNVSNINFLSAQVFDPIFFFFSEGDYINSDDQIITMTLSKRKIGDIPYPFRRYNSVDHDLIYREFDNEITGR